MSDKKFLIEGFVPAVVTPFNEAGDMMTDQLAQIIEWHLGEGADAICIAGDNGEAWALTPDDRKQLAETTVKTVAGRVPVLMGASAPTARQTIAAAEIAAQAGCAALMTGPQAYVGKSTTAEMVDRFKALNKAVPLPIVAYNSPRRTGLNMDPDMLGAVCDAAPIIGLKEASRDVFHITEIIKRFSDRLAFLVGPCPFILQALALGARGFISTGPELLGPGVAASLRAAAMEKPSAKTRDLHFALTDIYAFLMGTGTWPAALKAGLNMIGVPAGVPREPVQPLSPKDAEKLKALLENLGALPTAQAQAGE
jgi:4-hydroxy-tetrahydrodipicolinate synthase